MDEKVNCIGTIELLLETNRVQEDTFGQGTAKLDEDHGISSY